MNLPSWPYQRLGITWRQVWLTLFGMYIGMVVGLHTAADATPPEPAWLSALAGAAMFTAMFALSWLGVMAVFVPAYERFWGESV